MMFELMAAVVVVRWFKVHDLEKKYACTVTVVERDGASAAVHRVAVLCVEVANWRSKQKLVRLRFGLSTSFACLVGAPQVEVRMGGRGGSRTHSHRYGAHRWTRRPGLFRVFFFAFRRMARTMSYARCPGVYRMRPWSFLLF